MGLGIYYANESSPKTKSRVQDAATSTNESSMQLNLSTPLGEVNTYLQASAVWRSRLLRAR